MFLLPPFFLPRDRVPRWIRPVIQLTSRNKLLMFVATEPPIQDSRMQAPKTFRLRAFQSALIVVAIVGCLANRAQAFHQYFDVNGTTTGSGVVPGGSYTWEGTNWNNNNAGGNGATHARTRGGQLA